MKIQEVMKLQRKALGITQQDLADMSEMAISTIKKIESGKGNPSLSTVEKIMDILGEYIGKRGMRVALAP